MRGLAVFYPDGMRDTETNPPAMPCILMPKGRRPRRPLFIYTSLA